MVGGGRRAVSRVKLNLQAGYDVNRAEESLADTLKEIKPKPRHVMAAEVVRQSL